MMLSTALLLALQPAPPVSGTYVEARTAAVYAGACHFGGQFTTEGREAVLGWHFEAGSQDGVSLAGTDLALVVAGDANLDAEGVVRRSVLYLDSDAAPAVRDAARAWLMEHHAGAAGLVVRVKTAPVTVGRSGEGFEVLAGSDVELRGAALPERECCRMPYNVWYEPFAPVDGRLVGNAQAFRADEPALGRAWSRRGENDAFFGAFTR